MGVTRRAVVGGALAGVGNALLNLSDRRIRRRERAQELADARAWEKQKLQMQSLGGLSEAIAKDPSQAALLLQGAQANPLLQGLNLSSLRPPDPAIVAALKAKVAGVDDPANLPNAEDAAGLAGLNTTPVAPAGPGAGSQFGFMAPSSSFEGVNPSVQPVAQAVIDRRNALRQGQDDKVALEGRMKQAGSYGTTAGANQAKNENFPTELQNDVARERTMRPELAATAGAKSGAETAAQFSPDNNRRRSQSAGMVAGAETGARLDTENSRAGATAQREATIAGARKAAEAQPVVTAETQNDVIDTLELIKNIRKDPALATAVGPMDQYAPMTADIAGRNRIIALHNQLLGKLSLAQAGKLRGQGQITEKERELLMNAATALNRGLSERDYKQQLQIVEAQIARMLRPATPQKNGSVLNRILGQP